MKRLLFILLILMGAAWAQQGNTVTIGFVGVPAGSCSTIMYGINTANGDFYDCLAGAWNKVNSAGGAGTVTNTGGALTANAIVLGAGGNDTKVSTGLTTDGVAAITRTQGTIVASTPFTSHTATWNAAGVVFTNWLSNITCTAAASGSIAYGLGVAGTTWQFKYQAANCANPSLLLPAGVVAAPAIAIGQTNDGLFSNGAGLLRIGIGGTTIYGINSNLFFPASDNAVSLGQAANRWSTVVGNAITGNTYSTATNCAAVGTAANPSVASCTAASAGSFSCATNASTGTCTVNTTAVTANSEIFIEGRNDTTTGTRLGVTCNTGITTALPEISAVVAATSFTINLGTFTTNPECFSYFIVN